MNAAGAALSAVVGGAVGPGLAFLADRIPERKPLRGGGWRSPQVLPISIATGAVFGAVGARLGSDWALPAFLVFAACLLVVTVTDLRLFLIPNRIIYPTLLAAAVLLTLAAAIDGEWDALRQAAIGGVGAWLALLVVHLISPKGMAFGDVRLSAVIGVYTGWLGLGHVILALFLGFLFGAVVGVALIAARRRGRKDPVPFGPFLAAGALTTVLFGNAILDWYTGSA